MRSSIGKVSWALVMLVVGSRAVLAQETMPDTAHRFSVFVGPTLAASSSRLDFSLANNVGLGISRDFRGQDALFRPRVTASYDQWRSTTQQTIRVGSVVAEALLVPGELVTNVRPYLFGGLGLFSRLPMSGTVVVGGSLQSFDLKPYTYAGWSSGVGVEVGRAFVQYRFMTAVQNGPSFAGLNLGYRL